MTKTRKEGYYRVELDNKPQLAEWSGVYWYFCGSEFGYEDSELDKIGEFVTSVGETPKQNESNFAIPVIIESVCDAPKCLVKDNKVYDEHYCYGCDFNPKKQTVL